jgi:hypothetical protein
VIAIARRNRAGAIDAIASPPQPRLEG